MLNKCMQQFFYPTVVRLGYWVYCAFVTCSIARSAKRQYLSYSEADFEVFAPPGQHCTDDGEIWHGGGDRSYKRPAGVYPLRDFHKICRVCTPLQDTSAVKISLDLLKALWNYGGFKLTGSSSPKFSVPPSGETMHQTSKSFRGARTCSRSSITVPSLVGLGFHPPPGAAKNVEFFVCLSVCLSVTLLNVRVSAPDFAMKALEYRNDFDAVG